MTTKVIVNVSGSQAEPVLRLFPPLRSISHAQRSSGAIATVPFVWCGRTKSLPLGPGPALTLPCGWNNVQARQRRVDQGHHHP